MSQLPVTITKLTVHYWNKQQLPLPASSGITHLTLGDKFTRVITSLPIGLKYLKFGDYYNINIECPLPQLTHLILGTNFDRPIDPLPTTLTHLLAQSFLNHYLHFLLFSNHLLLAQRDILSQNSNKKSTSYLLHFKN